MTKRIWAAVAAGLALVAAGCTSGDVGRQSLERQLVDDAGLTADEADCLVDAIFEEFTQGEINDINKTDSFGELDGDVRDRLEEVYDGCEVPVG